MCGIPGTPPRRFTPTCVGTIAGSGLRVARPSVHPHVRGDNSTPQCPLTAWGGSPPRAWGQFVIVAYDEDLGRFTPTCVGTMLGLGGGIRRGYGSPPRAWGQFFTALADGVRERFTPTCVGTMCPAPGRTSAASVHPHVRGDNAAGGRSRVLLGGSPPRAWGQYQRQVLESARHRFTPTCVGTITAEEIAQARFSGSPPRAWGQCHLCVGDQVVGRFTPTCVGTMCTRRESACR